MYALLAITIALFPRKMDAAVTLQLKERYHKVFDIKVDITDIEKRQNILEYLVELFKIGSPKFISSSVLFIF